MNSTIFGLLIFMQPRLIVSGILINLFWILIRKGVKAGSLVVVVSLAITLFFPATLIYRNHKAVDSNSISTNLGITMSIGAGDNATGGYGKGESGVPCTLTGNASKQDNQRVKCVLKWYVNNPIKTLKLFYNKTLYFGPRGLALKAGAQCLGTLGLRLIQLQILLPHQMAINLLRVVLEKLFLGFGY